MAGFIAVIIIVVLLGACLVGWQSQRRRASKPVPPGPNIPQLHDLAPGPAVPGHAGFQINPDPGFVIVSRTNAPPGAATPVPGATAHTTTPAGFGKITQNLTAFCRLTGKRVADCSCTRCTKIKNGKAG